MNPTHRTAPPLHWQSQLLLLLVVPACTMWIFFQFLDAWQNHNPILLQTAGISISFGLIVWVLRAATGLAAVTGALITACLYLRTPGWHTSLIPLMAMLVLTLVSTRIGRERKEEVGTAEDKHGRQASQVAANLGAAALAALPLTATQLFSPSSQTALASIAGICAALAEATADTLSSELGQVFGGEPRLLTTLQLVPRGTDGGITLAGTAAGCLGAALVTIIATLTLSLDRKTGVNDEIEVVGAGDHRQPFG
jgi:uncharacterized protein (TIGR00297 family)